MKQFLIVLSGLICLGLFGQQLSVRSPFYVGLNRLPPAGGTPTYLIKQGFEGVGYDNSELWTNSGTVNPDYSTSPLDALESLYIGSTGSGRSTYGTAPVNTATSCWVYAMVKFECPPNTTTAFLQLENASGAAQFKASCATNSDSTNTMVLYLVHGSVNQTNATFLLTNVIYHIWMHYQTRVGATDGVGELYLSETSTIPGAPNISITAGTGLGTIYRAKCNADNYLKMVYDKIRLKTSSIGSTPE